MFKNYVVMLNVVVNTATPIRPSPEVALLIKTPHLYCLAVGDDNVYVLLSLNTIDIVPLIVNKVVTVAKYTPGIYRLMYVSSPLQKAILAYESNVTEVLNTFVKLLFNTLLII